MEYTSLGTMEYNNSAYDATKGEQYKSYQIHFYVPIEKSTMSRLHLEKPIDVM